MTQRLLDILVSSFPRLVLYCVQVTIPLTVCIYILSLVLGFLLALIQIQKIPVLKPLARVYVWVFRGTPLIVQMGYVFQNFNLFRNMTVKQNVLEGLITARGVDRATADKTADEVLEKVGMLHRKDFYPDQLSGGQQQRVAIARAIAFKPEVLLFDEPTSALDPELTREVLNTITQLAADGLTLVVVTHEMGFARNVSDRIIFMENGVVAEEAPAKEFFLHPRQEASKRFLRTVTDDYDYSI